MSYYQVELSVEIDGKFVKEQHITNKGDLVLAILAAEAEVNDSKATRAEEKKYVDVILDPTKDFFYEIKSEYLTVEGKSIKEDRLIQADSTRDAEDIHKGIDAKSEIKSNKQTKIKSFIN